MQFTSYAPYSTNFGTYTVISTPGFFHAEAFRMKPLQNYCHEQIPHYGSSLFVGNFFPRAIPPCFVILSYILQILGT